MEAFSEEYEGWRREPFPSGGADDELDELHADLVLADSWVAESVIPFVERDRFVPATVDVLQELRMMRGRAEGIGDPATRAAYVRYIDLLVNLYQSFLEQGGQPASP